MSPTLTTGLTLDNRYTIVQELGRGGFGCTYLATNSQQQYCVLKQFAPQVQEPKQLSKAEELFKREAGMLKRLQHPQIPRFHSLLRVNIQGSNCLFLVQDYIEGDSYYQLLVNRKRFDEGEVRKLLLDILPILEYIHNQNIIHRDISPDNLIGRNTDGKPVLIDFGCVKVAQTALSRFLGQGNPTRIGKPGYAPEEQFRGEIFPNSDLYALAVTVLVLHTGKEPQDLYNDDNGTWKWQRWTRLSSSLDDILTKMLAIEPEDRYPTASSVRGAILSPNTSTTQIPTRLVTEQSNSPFSILKYLKLGVLGSIALVIPGLISFALIKEKEPNLSPEVEEQIQGTIYERVKTLKINPGVFYQEVDILFYQKYPKLKGKKLSDCLEEQKFRKEWYDIAEELLEQREGK
ncbi:MAG: serine/threonine protein kinase [Prochloron sp. SP5CPC1]|nr:serine/threonine protein kinase [Candidatus Paraprochloron terpiosi SP5CPC1]